MPTLNPLQQLQKPEPTPAGAPVTFDDLQKKKSKLDQYLRDRRLALKEALAQQVKVILKHDITSQDEAVAAIKEVNENAKKATDLVKKFDEHKDLAKEVQDLEKQKGANLKRQEEINEELNRLKSNDIKNLIQLKKVKLEQLDRDLAESTEHGDMVKYQKSLTEKQTVTSELNNLAPDKLEKELKDLKKKFTGDENVTSDPDSIETQLAEKNIKLQNLLAEIGDTEKKRKENLIKFEAEKKQALENQAAINKLDDEGKKVVELETRLAKEEEIIEETPVENRKDALSKIHAKTTSLLKDGDKIKFQDLHDVTDDYHTARNQYFSTSSNIAAAAHLQDLETRGKGPKIKPSALNAAQTAELLKNIERKLDELNRTGDVGIGRHKIIRTGSGYQAEDNSIGGALAVTDLVISAGDAETMTLKISGGESITNNKISALMALSHGVKKVKFGSPPKVDPECTLIEKIFEYNEKLPSANSYLGKSKFADLMMKFVEINEKTGKPDPSAKEMIRLTLSALTADQITAVIKELRDDTAGQTPKDTLKIIYEQMAEAIILKLERSVNKQDTKEEINDIFKEMDAEGKKELLKGLHTRFEKISPFTRKTFVPYQVFDFLVKQVKQDQAKYDELLLAAPAEQVIAGKKSTGLKACIEDSGKAKSDEGFVAGVVNTVRGMFG